MAEDFSSHIKNTRQAPGPLRPWVSGVERCVQITKPNDPEIERHLTNDLAKVGSQVVGVGISRPIAVERYDVIKVPGQPGQIVKLGESSIALSDGTSASGRRIDERGSAFGPMSPGPQDSMPMEAGDGYARAPQAEVAKPEFEKSAVSAADLAAAIGQRHAPVPAPQKNVMVKISGGGMGKTTVFCRRVVEDDKTVAIVYPADGSVAIVEPPTANSKNPIELNYEGKTLKCASYGLSFSDNGCLYVVLVKV